MREAVLLAPLVAMLFLLFAIMAEARLFAMRVFLIVSLFASALPLAANLALIHAEERP